MGGQGRPLYPVRGPERHFDGIALRSQLKNSADSAFSVCAGKRAVALGFILSKQGVFMKYISQLDYPHIPYPTDTDHPAKIRESEETIETSGCGICSLCMVVDQLTTEELSLQECIQMSFDIRANHAVGTDMKILGPVVAERYALRYSATDDVRSMICAVRNGGRAIANVGGAREGHAGVFSHVGHYIAVIGAKENEVCILDPSLENGKFESPERRGKVRMDGFFVYCSPEVLDKDASNRVPRYHIFERR